MITKVDVPVSVELIFQAPTRKVFPKLIVWNGRDYVITKLGYKHTIRQGRTLLHIFSVVSNDTYFKLVLNTDTLHWKLEEVSDGQPS